MRSECEAVADAVWALVEARLVRKHRDTLLEAANAVGITMADLRDASIRWERGWRSRPRREPESMSANGSVPPSTNGGLRVNAPDRRVNAPDRRVNAPAWPVSTPAQRAREPADDPEKLPPQPTDRRCVGPCGHVLPAAKFAGNDRTCRRCRNLRRRELRVEKAQLINAVRLRFKVTDADGLTSPLCCMECGLVFHVGELVEGKTSLRHAVCPPDGLHRHSRPPRCVVAR